MTNEERASKLLTDLEAVCNDYAGIEQDCKLKELFIAALADARRAALEECKQKCQDAALYYDEEAKAALAHKDDELWHEMIGKRQASFGLMSDFEQMIRQRASEG